MQTEIEEKLSTIKTNPQVAAQLMAEVRANLGPELDAIEESGYARGFEDGRHGRARSAPRRAFSQSSPAVAHQDAATSGDGPVPSPYELAVRASVYQAEQEKLGRKVSNTDAVKHVYEQAGVPLD